MSEEEALQHLEQECPRKIIGLLHLRGHYVHCTSSRFPGKVLCFHRDSEVPEDCQPTAAQQQLWQIGAQGAAGATG
jgi:hypothetical protein